ncbi:MAG: hypothetical protein E7Z80_03795 [Methanobrevibacter thaueri]|nr:hypothetical protein [Methanobrevibacter thaueri]
MDRNEIIFFIIIILAYLICSQTLKIPYYINYIMIGAIIIALTVTAVLNYGDKLSYEKKYNIMKLLLIISSAVLLLDGFFEFIYHKTLIPLPIIIFIILDLIIGLYYIKTRL